VRKRDELANDLKLAGRKLSTATILFHQAVADRLGLNLTDHKCVDLLLLNGPLTAGELAIKTTLTTGAITAALDRLEKAGFVTREDDPQDRRRVIDSFSALLDDLAARYKASELALIVDFMTRSCAVLHESTLELRQQSVRADKKKRR